jgi:hypothetical protein
MIQMSLSQSQDQGGGSTNPVNPGSSNASTNSSNQAWSGTNTFNGPSTFNGAVTQNSTVTYGSGASASFYNQSFQVGTLTSTTPLYLNLTNQVYQTVTLTNNATLASTNRAAGRGVTLRLIASGADRSVVFPAWVFIGTSSTNIASGKTAILSVQFFGTNETDGVAAISVQP